MSTTTTMPPTPTTITVECRRCGERTTLERSKVRRRGDIVAVGPPHAPRAVIRAVLVCAHCHGTIHVEVAATVEDVA